jgi:RNA polymerase sigma-70 factor (ECF subfamily)
MALAEEKINRAGEDDRHERFTALMSRQHASLMGFTLSLVPNWSDAEDILQQASVVMWRKFGEFQEGTDFLAWGCQVVRFHVTNFVRKRARDKHLFSPELIETMAGEALGDAEHLASERAALQACLGKLDDAGRKLLARCYEPQATIRQVAHELGRTPNSVYKGLNRLRETLLRCIRRTLSREGA